MNTPIYDFVQNYINSDASRFHIPGHKGRAFLGCEERDITEIGGADVLYSPDGIIAESESNATSLFGSAHSFIPPRARRWPSAPCLRWQEAQATKHSP